MKILGDRVESVERKAPWEAPQNNPPRNPNFRRNPNPNVGRTNPDPEIRPPFQENYAETSTSTKPNGDPEINLMGLDGESQVFLTQEDHEDEEIKLFQSKSGESFDFKQGYDTAVYEVHKQYKLRSRTVNVNPPEKKKDNQQPERVIVTEPDDKINSPAEEVMVEEITEPLSLRQQSLDTSSSHPNLNATPQEMSKKDKYQSQDKNLKADLMNKERTVTYNHKAQSEKPFDLETEIGKIKIDIPLLELAKHDIYKLQIKKSLQLTSNKDDVNVLDDTPELLFGPEVDGKTVVTGVLPFYVSLHIHDKIVHNAMFDSGASHNLMPKAVMERLNLDITRPYKDLFSFDSSQVKCLGLIKDLCVSLVQYPNKTILMDVVVADIPPKYGMLLSRSWGANLQGSLQLDMSYATISVFGQPKRLYRETLMKYMVSSEEKPQNFPIYVVHSDIDSYILFNETTTPSKGEVETKIFIQEEDANESSITHETTVNQTLDSVAALVIKNIQLNDETVLEDKLEKKPQLLLTLPAHEQITKPPSQQDILWFLEFDGSVNKLGVGAGVWVHNKENSHAEGRAYRLNFGCTNNMAEYEALLLGIKLAKFLQATKVSIMGDSDLVIQQVKETLSPMTKD